VAGGDGSWTVLESWAPNLILLRLVRGLWLQCVGDANALYCPSRFGILSPLCILFLPVGRICGSCVALVWPCGPCMVLSPKNAQNAQMRIYYGSARAGKAKCLSTLRQGHLLSTISSSSTIPLHHRCATSTYHHNSPASITHPIPPLRMAWARVGTLRCESTFVIVVTGRGNKLAELEKNQPPSLLSQYIPFYLPI
jgi:hypothetical protein